jgi:hypothetical protein
VIKIFTKESIPAPPTPEITLPATTAGKDWPKALNLVFSIAICIILKRK